MQFRTIVPFASTLPPIAHADAVLLLGSCFADVVGLRLADARWRCDVNPMGPLYNPASVAEGLQRLLDGTPFKEDELTHFPAEGYGTWMHHTLLSRPTPQEALEAMNSRVATGAALLHDQRPVLMVTFGTAWVYRLRDNGCVVANCHRVPASHFTRTLLSVDDTVALWRPLLQLMVAQCPQLRLLCTVSPVRHLSDGAHANSLSKATLLLATDRLMDEARALGLAAEYFPAYEMVLDELRDYRFFADDMAHPSAQAEEYVWERFVESCLDDGAREFLSRWDDVQRALDHRPFRPQSIEYRRFVQHTLAQLECLKKDYPYIDIETDIQRCRTLLNN